MRPRASYAVTLAALVLLVRLLCAPGFDMSGCAPAHAGADGCCCAVSVAVDDGCCTAELPAPDQRVPPCGCETDDVPEPLLPLTLGAGSELPSAAGSEATRSPLPGLADHAAAPLARREHARDGPPLYVRHCVYLI